MAKGPQGQRFRQEGTTYNGPWDWVLQHGRVMCAGDGTWTPEEREFIHALERDAHFVPNDCHANAQWAVLRVLTKPSPGTRFTYCEGYAARIGQEDIFDHAWCLLNGRVWDPSPALVVPDGAPLYVYMGAEFLTRFLVESLDRKIVRPGYSLLDNPWKGYPVLRLDVSQVCPPR